MRKWQNWKETDQNWLKTLMNLSIQQSGQVRIFARLDHVSQSGLTRYITLWIPIVRDGAAYMTCIAREKKMEGGGMDMGFELAYNMYMSIYCDETTRPYQKWLAFQWL